MPEYSTPVFLIHSRRQHLHGVSSVVFHSRSDCCVAAASLQRRGSHTAEVLEAEEVPFHEFFSWCFSCIQLKMLNAPSLQAAPHYSPYDSRHRYNYMRLSVDGDVAVEMLERAQDCVICMQPFDVDGSDATAITPCDHVR
jgi:hypothetical protein